MLKELGLMGLLMLGVFLILLPLIVTIIVGISFANMLGFTGLSWWAFVILFYLIVGAIINMVRT